MMSNQTVPQGYKQTEVGIIPDDWEVVRLKELTKINQGLQIKISDRYTEKMEDSYFYITNEFLKIGGKKFFIKNPSESVICNKNDVLMTRTGNTGQVVTNVSGVFHNNFFKIKYSNEIAKNYLVYFLKTPKIQNTISNYAGSSTIPDLNHSDFYRLKIPLPPKPEQQKIADILSTWDKAIEKQTALITQKQHLKKGLMQQLLTAKTRFSEFGGDWKEKKLNDISRISTGNSNRENSTYNDGQYAFFDRSQDIRTSDIFLFDGEAVIVAGEGQEFIPKYFIGKFDLHQRTYAIMDFSNSLGKFIFYYINQNRNYFLSQAVGSTVKSLRLPMFKKMIIRLPPIREQQKITQVLSLADDEITKLQTALDLLKTQKKGLMQQLLTGKIRVKA